MYIIDKETNSITPLKQKSFSELKFKERAHLQEWIVSHPECLGEPLLIIQKEFSGFSDTYERLDLLALDKEGNLVIIENKLDDSGRDVTWQALKYAAYCSTLTKDQIEEIFQSYLLSQKIDTTAAQILSEFFDNYSYQGLFLNKLGTQRIIFIAAKFRKEVTSTVLWLMNFKIQLQCFRVTPYELNDQHFLTLDQIIPTKDAQDYVISMANKAHEELTTAENEKSRHKVRLEFWKVLLNDIKGKSTLFQSSNPSRDHWLVAGGTNISGLSYQFIITMTKASVVLNIARYSTEENKLLFDFLSEKKLEIEKMFGANLTWERLDQYKSSRVSYSLEGVNYFLKEDWPKIIGFLIANINKLELSTQKYFVIMKDMLKSPVAELEEN